MRPAITSKQATDQIVQRLLPYAHSARLLICLALLFLSFHGIAGNDIKKTLLLSATFDRTSTAVGQRVYLTATLQNQGQSPVVLRGARDLSAGGGFALTVKTPSGQTTSLPATPGMSLAEAQTGERHIVIRPGAGIRLRFPIDIQSSFFSQKGKYGITLSYQSPAPSPGNTTVIPGQLEGESADPAVLTLNVGDGASE